MIQSIGGALAWVGFVIMIAACWILDMIRALIGWGLDALAFLALLTIAVIATPIIAAAILLMRLWNRLADNVR